MSNSNPAPKPVWAVKVLYRNQCRRIIIPNNDLSYRLLVSQIANVYMCDTATMPLSGTSFLPVSDSMVQKFHSDMRLSYLDEQNTECILDVFTFPDLMIRLGAEISALQTTRSHSHLGDTLYNSYDICYSVPKKDRPSNSIFSHVDPTYMIGVISLRMCGRNEPRYITTLTPPMRSAGPQCGLFGQPSTAAFGTSRGGLFGGNGAFRNTPVQCDNNELYDLENDAKGFKFGTNDNCNDNNNNNNNNNCNADGFGLFGSRNNANTNNCNNNQSSFGFTFGVPSSNRCEVSKNDDVKNEDNAIFNNNNNISNNNNLHERTKLFGNTGNSTIFGNNRNVECNVPFQNTNVDKQSSSQNNLHAEKNADEANSDEATLRIKLTTTPPRDEDVQKLIASLGSDVEGTADVGFGLQPARLPSERDLQSALNQRKVTLPHANTCGPMVQSFEVLKCLKAKQMLTNTEVAACMVEHLGRMIGRLKMNWNFRIGEKVSLNSSPAANIIPHLQPILLYAHMSMPSTACEEVRLASEEVYNFLQNEEKDTLVFRKKVLKLLMAIKANFTFEQLAQLMLTCAPLSASVVDMLPTRQTAIDTMVPFHLMVHCDGCKQYPIVGSRFKCNMCADYDLCAKCYLKKNAVHTHQHTFRHILEGSGLYDSK